MFRLFGAFEWGRPGVEEGGWGLDGKVPKRRQRVWKAQVTHKFHVNFVESAVYTLATDEFTLV